MKLHIPRVQQRNFGIYACKAKNPRGDTDGTITLSEKPSLTPPTTSSTTTTTTTTTKRTWKKKGQMYGSSLNEFENRHNTRKKDKHSEYYYETTSRYDSDHLYGNNSYLLRGSVASILLAIIIISLGK